MSAVLGLFGTWLIKRSAYPALCRSGSWFLRSLSPALGRRGCPSLRRSVLLLVCARTLGGSALSGAPALCPYGSLPLGLSNAQLFQQYCARLFEGLGTVALRISRGFAASPSAALRRSATPALGSSGPRLLHCLTFPALKGSSNGLIITWKLRRSTDRGFDMSSALPLVVSRPHPFFVGAALSLSCARLPRRSACPVRCPSVVGCFCALLLRSFRQNSSVFVHLHVVVVVGIVCMHLLLLLIAIVIVIAAPLFCFYPSRGE